MAGVETDVQSGGLLGEDLGVGLARLAAAVGTAAPVAARSVGGEAEVGGCSFAAYDQDGFGHIEGDEPQAVLAVGHEFGIQWCGTLCVVEQIVVAENEVVLVPDPVVYATARGCGDTIVQQGVIELGPFAHDL